MELVRIRDEFYCPAFHERNERHSGPALPQCRTDTDNNGPYALAELSGQAASVSRNRDV